MGQNIHRLGDILEERMKKTANATVTVVTEMGTINENMSLTPDSLQSDIPQGDYLIQAGQHLEAGDRVLISWCGNDAVITGPASEEEEPMRLDVQSNGQGTVKITY